MFIHITCFHDHDNWKYTQVLVQLYQNVWLQLTSSALTLLVELFYKILVRFYLLILMTFLITESTLMSDTCFFLNH